MSSTETKEDKIILGTWGLEQERRKTDGPLDAYVATTLVSEGTGLSREDVEQIMESDRVSVRGQSDEKIVKVQPKGDPPLQHRFIDPDIVQNDSSGADHNNESAEDDLTVLSDIEEGQASALKNAGFTTYASIHNAEEEALRDVPSINSSLATKIKREAGSHMNRKDIIAQQARNQVVTAKESGDDDSASDAHIITDIEIPAGDPVPMDNEDHRFEYIHRLQNPDECDGRHPETPDLEDFQHFKTRHINTDTDAVSSEIGLYQAPEDPSGGETVVEVVTRFMAKGRPINLVGHAGIGKDHIVKYVCANRNQPCLVLNMDRSMIPEDLLGIHSISDDGTIVFEDGPLLHAAKYGWTLVVDEINTGKAGVLAALFQLLEEGGKLYVKGKNEAITPHPEFQFISTMNPPTADYQGAEELNDALESRLNCIWVPYLATSKEADTLQKQINAGGHEILTYSEAEALVQTANDFREKAATRGGIRVSTRDLKEVADWYDGEHNGSLISAFQETIRTIGGPTVDRESEMEYAADKLSEHLA